MSHRLPSNEKKLFVRGLSDDIKEDDVKDIFSPFGKVTEVLIPHDYETQQSKGYAFVTFDSLSDCKEACREMHGKKYKSRELFVEAAIPKSSKGNYRYSFRGRQRSDEFYNSRDSRHTSGYGSRRSPSPRNFSHRERRPYDRHHNSYEGESRSYYREERAPRYERRNHDDRYADDDQHRYNYDFPRDQDYSSQQRLSGKIVRYTPPQETECHSKRDKGGRRYRSQSDQSEHMPGNGQHSPCQEEYCSFQSKNDYDDSSHQRSEGYPSSSRRTNVEKSYHEAPMLESADSRYDHRDDFPSDDRKMGAIRRRLPPSSPHSKRM